MMDKQAILAAVPIRNRRVMIEPNQDVRDIIKCITFYHKQHIPQYDQFAYRFDVGTERDIARALFRFCKDNLDYDIEGIKSQTVRSPGRMLMEGQGDCKHYASFIAGVLDSLKRSGLDLDWAYRFAEYTNSWGDVSNHVFVILRTPDGKEIWIDPVLNWFDYHLPYDRAITRTIDTLPKDQAVGCISSYLAGYCGMGCNCQNMGAAGDRTLPVPAGYPANLPIPVMTSDGKLLLRPVVKKYLSSQEILWIQKALQPLIIQYSPTPYNIYWSVKGWGSGAGNIQVATSPLDLGTHNFLEYPRQPSGFDKVLIGLNDVLPALVGYAANIVVPGSGSFVSNAISSQTSSAKETNTSMELSPSQLQNAQQQPPSTGLLSAGVSIGPLLMIAGAGLFILSSNKR